MAQVRRPVPFRTRKLRPGTAMVLHPTGCGRVARRRTTRTGSPSEHTPQGAFPISETLTTQTHTPPQKHPGLLALMRPTSGTIPGRPRRRGRRETARRVPISAGNPENSTSVTVESRRPGLLPPVCCADGSPPLRGARNWLGYGVALHWLLLCITSPLNVALRRIKSCITIRRRFSVPLIKA